MSGYSSIESAAGLRVAKCQLHGVLVHVHGVGILLTGESGVGKTACAIELLRRGHSLVADDAVEIFQKGGHIFGRAPEITRSFVHIRGVGIACVTDLFHHATLLNECTIDVRVDISHSEPEAPISEDGVPFFRIQTGPPKVIADKTESIARGYSGS